MTIDVSRGREVAQLVDWERGLIDRAIFTDKEIYQLELEQIFARAWNFMCHDSQIPNPGDFVQNYIGEDRVICVRDNDGNPQVVVNSCRHRGNAVCRAEEGHASSFMCTYHGWTYDLKGNLVGVPGFKEVYHEELDREHWGLIKAGKVESYNGFVFATMDPEAVSLGEYLGEVGRMSLDFIAARGRSMKVVAGIQKYIIPANWKLAVDNVWDYYHGVTHMSAGMSGWPQGMNRRPGAAMKRTSGKPQVVLLEDYGHSFAGPTFPESAPGEAMKPEGIFETGWRETEKAKDALGPVGITFSAGHPNIFPNLWVTQACQVCIRLPKGPHSTEIWWYTILDEELTPEQHRAQQHRNGHHFGPAGIFEQDDGENWGESTKGARGAVTSKFPLNYTMGMGRGEVIDDEQSPLRIETGTNEHPQLWHYRAWADWMAADTWADLRANHTRSPRGVI